MKYDDIEKTLKAIEDMPSHKVIAKYPDLSFGGLCQKLLDTEAQLTATQNEAKRLGEELAVAREIIIALTNYIQAIGKYPDILDQAEAFLDTSRVPGLVVVRVEDLKAASDFWVRKGKSIFTDEITAFDNINSALEAAEEIK